MNMSDTGIEVGMIKGGDLYLRPMTVADTDLIIRWRNQDFVRRNFIQQALFTREGHLHWIETMIKTGRAVQFIICTKDNVPVGSVYLRDIDTAHKHAEYGIFIGEESALSKGYGTKAAGLMTAYAFEKLKLHKLKLRVLAENKRAVRSYEKAGFEQEAYLKEEVYLEGRYKDVILMARINIGSEENG